MATGHMFLPNYGAVRKQRSPCARRAETMLGAIAARESWILRQVTGRTMQFKTAKFHNQRIHNGKNERDGDVEFCC
jgi:hypothetical protein